MVSPQRSSQRAPFRVGGREVEASDSRNSPPVAAYGEPQRVPASPGRGLEETLAPG